MAPSAPAASAGGIPPVLPPSVEEAYRRKCVQLRQRLNEVEEANDASRLRLARTHRGIEKMRLERAFLLEQLAKRTSTNVEDSEGSPSPPPTPKEKPLRVKRGHRKPSFLQDTNNGPEFANNPNAPTLSPSSESFSHQNPNRDPLPMPSSNRPRPSVTNGSGLRPSPPKKFTSAWEMFAASTKNRLIHEHQQAMNEGTYNVDHELANLWNNMEHQQKEYWFNQERAEQDKAMQPRNASMSRAVSNDMGHDERPPQYRGGGPSSYEHHHPYPPPVALPPPPHSLLPAEHLPQVKREEEDTEMRDEAPAPPVSQEGEGGGFTAINRSN